MYYGEEINSSYHCKAFIFSYTFWISTLDIITGVNVNVDEESWTPERLQMIDIPPASVQCRGGWGWCTVEMAGSICVMYSRQQCAHNTAAVPHRWAVQSYLISHIIVSSYYHIIINVKSYHSSEHAGAWWGCEDNKLGGGGDSWCPQLSLPGQ